VRRAASALAIMLAMAPTAFAQVSGGPASNQGSFALDAMVAPTTGFGFGYYLTDGLSLRPWLGLGYANEGFFANVGAQLQYEFGTGSMVSPYLSASGLYSHSPQATYVQPGRPGSPTSQQLGYSADGAQFGAGAGLRFRVARSFSLFAEGRALYSTYSNGTLEQQGWGTFNTGDHTRAEFVLGLSYLFH
jgi:Autotransporter beta-domain